MGIESSVAVKVVIDKDGKVSSYDFVSGDSAFHLAIKKALKTWRFSPHFVDGKPVETSGTLKFMFKLNSSDAW
jgi:protein TonB